MTTNGVAVGKWVSVGVMSQPTLAQLSSLNNTLFNQNPDITLVPVVPGTGAGVTGGHFDVDIFYADPSGGAQASATITVGTSGQTADWPATLGGIAVNGVTIVPALTVSDITDGTNNSINRDFLVSLINQGTTGFTASSRNNSNVITIKAPVGAQYNNQPITIVAGTSSVGTPGSAPTNGSIVITNVDRGKNNVSIRCGNTYITGAPGDISSLNSDTKAERLNDLFTKINGKTVNGYTTSCTKVNSPTSSLSCTIQAPAGAAACTTFTPSQSIDITTTVGLSGGTSGTGWTNYAPALTATAFNNAGVEPNSNPDTCVDTDCKYRTHFHQYDDVFDVTGVNMLNPSSTTLNIKLGIASLSQNFKVIVQNQYLNPAVKLHIGDPSYLYNVDFGYIPLKNYTTSATLDLATLQTYRRDTNVAWTGSTPPTADQLALPKTIGSLAFNMPLDALTPKDWYGNGDVRVGLHPTVYRCVWQAESDHDGNMYQPVVPPANGTAGRGNAGWNNSTTPTTATGARHNGALVIQLIKDTTPNSALEQNVAGRPEYGWRVKSALFSQYVLMEYATYWHHPNGKCYSDTGWTKTPAADNGSSTLGKAASGSTDPHIGNLSAGSAGTGNGTVTSVTTTVAGAVTTSVITYVDGTHATVVRTANADGTVTIVTTDAAGVVTTQQVLNLDGSLKTGGDELGRIRAISGRISWRELVAP
jgi:hypothetical protein